MHTNIHCSTVYNSKDLEPTQMPIDDRLDRENVAHITMEYYAAIKNDEFVSFVGTWMSLETIILSKLTKSRKPNTAYSHSQWVLNNESTWTQGEEHHTVGSVKGKLGEGQQGLGSWGVGEG